MYHLKYKIIIFLMLLSSVNAQEKPGLANQHAVQSFSSKILQEEREYRVYLPTNYDNKKEYPVLYMLDGAENFSYAAGVISNLSTSGKTPELIMVSIISTNRERDYTPTKVTHDAEGTPQPWFHETGGADTFLKFLKTEFIPKIELKYSTSDERVLFGHSASGLFTAYAILSDPNFIDHFILSDPSLWWDEEVLINWINDGRLINKSFSNRVYIATAHHENDAEDNNIVRSQINFVKAISDLKSYKIQIKNKYYLDETHSSIELKALYDGLSFIFEDEKSPPQ